VLIISGGTRWTRFFQLFYYFEKYTAFLYRGGIGKVVKMALSCTTGFLAGFCWGFLLGVFVGSFWQVFVGVFGYLLLLMVFT